MNNLIKKELMSKLIDINMAIDAICNEWCGVNHKDCKHPFNPETDDYYWCDGCETVLSTLLNMPSAEPDMAENLCLCKCYITDKDGFRHEVIYTDDIRRVTGWEI